eukprot:8236833-Lingulodinium_polyedra.AAC.1
MGCPWTVHGQSMDCPCVVRGQYTDNPWIVHGLVGPNEELEPRGASMGSARALLGCGMGPAW